MHNYSNDPCQCSPMYLETKLPIRLSLTPSHNVPVPTLQTKHWTWRCQFLLRLDVVTGVRINSLTAPNICNVFHDTLSESLSTSIQAIHQKRNLVGSEDMFSSEAATKEKIEC